MQGEVIIWAIPESNRIRIGASIASLAPIPFSAEIIVRVTKEDANITKAEVKRYAKNGLSIEKIKALYE